MTEGSIYFAPLGEAITSSQWEQIGILNADDAATFLRSINEDIAELARVTRTPPMFIEGEMAATTQTGSSMLQPLDVIDTEAELLACDRYRPPTSWARHTPEGLLDTRDILPPLNSPPRDVIPPMPVNHVTDLCLCLHSRLQHSSVLGAPAGPSARMPDGQYLTEIDQNVEGRPEDGYQWNTTDRCSGLKSDGSPCNCRSMNRVSRMSVHALQRGQQVTKRRVADLKAGDRVLAGWSTYVGRVRLLAVKSGALVVTVRGKEPKLADDSDRHWTRRMWLVDTDLGQSLPQAGGDFVLVVK